jgi:hypothetical protein
MRAISLLALVGALSGCTGGATCGPGTELVDGVCTAVDADADADTDTDGDAQGGRTSSSATRTTTPA